MALYEREVAYLIFQHTAEPVVEQSWNIHANDQDNIGRQHVQKIIGVEDRCISKHHLKIHCVEYAGGDDDTHRVAPMVWVRVLSNNAVRFNRHGVDKHEDDGIWVTRDHGDVLLNPGDIMHLTSNVRVVFAVPEEYHSRESTMDASQIAELAELARHDFTQDYLISQRVLGVGGYAKVYVANNEKTGKQVACKIVKQARPGHDEDNELRPRKKHNKEIVAREFNLLKKLSHPNIIALEAVICTPHNVYIFQDLITGGDLMSHLDRMGPLKEPQAAVIVRQLLEAVKYLHAEGVAHRDIKPENILMTSWRDGGRIVLTDFGQARTIEDVNRIAAKTGMSRMQTLVGTVGYVAPEITLQLQQAAADRIGYSQAVDIWSVGCVTCTILSADVLFEPENLRIGLSMEDYDRCMERIDSGRDWIKIHRRAKDFIKGCIDLDEETRLTATEALASEWFRHPNYRDDMDAAYKRAIADWKPKGHCERDLIKHISTEYVEKPKAETVHSQYFDSQFHASPLVPNTPLRDRRGSDEQSTFLAAPPQYEEDDYGNNSFQQFSLEELDLLEKDPGTQFMTDSLSTCPAPPFSQPPFSPRKKVCR